jgi:uncharacterized protein YtpQ (UPF0354 family)
MCKKRHNSLLHFEKATNSESESVQNDPLVEINGDSRISIPAKVTNGHVFLSTAIVWVTDDHGNNVKCRTILDTGSQVNFISKKLLNTLKLSSKRVKLPVRGIGASSIQSAAAVEVKVKSRVKLFDTSLCCYVLP